MSLLALVWVATACGPLAPALMDHVEASPPAVSPNLRNPRNRLDVHYHLSAPATVTTQIVSADGQQQPIATNASRPARGDYLLQFDGTVAGPGRNERRVLPDGDYQLVLDAQRGSQHQEASVPLTIRGADTTTLQIAQLALLPDTISPNFDALDDVTHITYVLAKDAMVSAFLDTAPGSGDPKRIWTGEEVPTSAGDQTLTWDGTANGQPVASGQYQLGVRARDQAGNVVEQSQPLTVEDAGVPDASIVSTHIGPLQVTRGSEVCLDAIVRNTGQTVLRTQGPDPGYVYNSLDSFSSIENHAYAEHAGLWRVGMSASGSTDLSGAAYPYRWGFGRDLQPGDEATVHGCVTVQNEQDKLVFFAGLIQENVAIHSAGAGLVRVSISS